MHQIYETILLPVIKPLNMSRSSSSKFSGLLDGLVFTAGAFLALLMFFGLYSFLSPTPLPNRSSSISFPFSSSSSKASPTQDFDLNDPEDRTFYDDKNFGYTIDQPIKNWDAKRLKWLRLHPSFSSKNKERVLMISGSQPKPCRSSDGDHLLLRFLKNKIDYCRIHGVELFYNTALLNPSMPTFWAKIPIIRAAMVAHPEAEWLWWVDSDAIFTDMDFSLPLDRYKNHNLVVHGWLDLVYKKSWVSLNAGVFLIRNCQWSMDFMDDWASMGPQSPDYEQWGKTLTSTFKDKVIPESDDQSGLVYLILTGKNNWRDKIYLENEYYFQGYWLEIVGKLHTISNKYQQMESKGPEKLRRRHAEKVFVSYARERTKELEKEKQWAFNGPKGWKRPFVTHFTGCQPCSGDRNKNYSGDNCTEGMYKALNFADDQVLRVYGFGHEGLESEKVKPLPFDYPRSGR